MRLKIFGGTLLITGTAIGGGILALPIATAELGFVHSSLLLFLCWFLMTASAFLILEVTLWLPKNTNIISMARATLGPVGQLTAWVTYFLLLYSLLAAYIAGGSDLFDNLLRMANIHLPAWAVSWLFTILLGLVVFAGIRGVDYANRILMSVKFLTFFLLMGLAFSHTSLHMLSGGRLTFIYSGATVAITSFGYSTMVPTLRDYFRNDVKRLRWVIFVGSLLPLICYIAWDLTIMGVIPREELLNMQHSGSTTSDFVNRLSMILNRETITTLAHTFTSICLLTSFLGVALCLVDFLADAFSVEKQGKMNFLVCCAALIPPLLIVLFKPGIFIAALAYAGIYCIVLLALLPILMAWRGRYHKKIANGYQVFGGKPLLVILFVLTMAFLIEGIFTVFIK